MMTDGLDTNLLGFKLISVTNAAKDQDAGPAICCGKLREVATKKCAPHRAATIDHKHAPFAWPLHGGTDKRIVFKDFKRGDGAMKGCFAAIVEKDWINMGNRICVCVAQIGSRKR
jgi:hypothetical protein